MSALTLAEKIDPGSTVLLVIDMQNDYIHPEGFLGKAGADTSQVITMVPTLCDLLETARRAGVTVMHTRNWHRPATDSPAWLDKLARLGQTQERRPAIAGSWGAGWYEVEPLPGEEVINKFRYDAFLGTNLEFLLRARGIRTVVITGTATNVCVESTARAAHMRDFHLVMVADACGSGNVAAHEGTLANIAANFGEVTSAARIKEVWTAGR
jgi:ureidoacrylate peracid hydrolase